MTQERYFSVGVNVAKKVWYLAILLFMQHTLNAQQIIFSENFENKILSTAWQPVSGDWHIGDVDEMRIAPAENGYRYVLCANNEGFIRLLVDIPDTIKASQVKLSFAYYTYSKGPGASVEIEFHQKDLKDGLKGKMSKFNLPVKGRWSYFQRTIKIPADANLVWVGFSEAKPTSKNSKTICFDSIVLAATR